MLNTSKLLDRCGSFETNFLDEHLNYQEFKDFDELISYLDGGYIQDAISEFADSNTSIYYSDIEEYAKNNYDRINDTISEFGWDGCGEDLNKASQLAEYCEIQEKCYEDTQVFKKFLEDNYQF